MKKWQQWVLIALAIYMLIYAPDTVALLVKEVVHALGSLAHGVASTLRGAVGG